MKNKIIVIMICMTFCVTICTTLGETKYCNFRPIVNKLPNTIISNIENFDNIEVIDQQQTTDCGSGCPFFSYLWLAQGFTPTLETITKVELKLFKEGNPLSDIILSIRSTLTGSDLTSVSIAGSQVSEYGKWIEFDFTDIIISTNQMYYIVCRTPGGSAINYYCCLFQINNPYPGGDVWGSLNSGTTWEIIEYPGYPEPDGCFRTYGLDETPNNPNIDGPSHGNAGTKYTYTFSALDPESHDVFYYIKWGDSTNTGWIGPYAVGTPVTADHRWISQGTYTINAKAKDIYGAESDWGELQVTMPRDRTMKMPLLNFLDQYPILYQLLQRLL